MRVSKAAKVGIVGALLVGAVSGAALLYANPGRIDKAPGSATPAESPLAVFATGPIAALEAPAALQPAPAYVFKAADGADARVSDFRGKVVVLNVWAMWCAPCKTEMPTLATLARSYPDEAVAVVTVNVDHDAKGIADARRFIDAHAPLPLYSDPKFQLPFELPGKGKMPQTVLIDRQGRIRAHLSGGADWSSTEAKALIDALLAEA